MPARKPGKLPHDTISAEYILEYGVDALEMHADALAHGARVLVHDDLLATGGTARALCELVESRGAEVVGCAFLVELSFLDGRERLAGLRRADARRLRRRVMRTRARACCPAPRERVWEIVGDPYHEPRWWPRVERVEAVTKQGWTSVMTSAAGGAVRADWTLEDEPHAGAPALGAGARGDARSSALLRAQRGRGRAGARRRRDRR